MLREIKLASPRGFCAGVDRAIEIVNRALELYGAPVYVRHEVVHNHTVVANLHAKGAIFVEEVEEVKAEVEEVAEVKAEVAKEAAAPAEDDKGEDK